MWQEGLTFRELTSSRGSGFVLRVLRDDVQPPQIVTATRQPGHRNVTIEALRANHDLDPNHFYSTGPAESVTVDLIASRLQALSPQNELATVALEHLLTPTEI